MAPPHQPPAPVQDPASVQPQAPAQDPAPVQDPAPGPAPTPVKKDRRVLRAALRWTAAVVVFAVAGAGTAYGIAAMKRTDVPGLATQADGRWDYPTLVKAPLPSGSPEPFAEDNTAGAHYADLRELVLPAPEGAVQDKKLRGKDGWLATKDFLAEYAPGSARDDLRQEFVDDGLRHIAARGWTTPDGTRTRVYLLQFGTAEVVDDLFSHEAPIDGPRQQLRGTEGSVFDTDFPAEAHDHNVEYSVYIEKRPRGAEQTRQGYLSAGDVLAVIVQSRKGGAKAVPFRQTVALQSELLG
ncbi:hypothetical protein [Streptomyces sp. TLI_185]|uniref:hypothetical protein n=1 Tax=Streptomyces sp. TLI_185 TaxID=2485151 RepID=UPI0021A61372|nr:hypothetical protein [Streptomyces sp. TLI_185]